jgi:hypothetical protein
MVNVDLKTRGSVKKRTGREFNMQLSGLGFVQGVFVFNKPSGSSEFIFAINGYLYKRSPVSNSIPTSIPFVGAYNGVFQQTRTVEAVQFYDKLYVATGSGIAVVQYFENTDSFSWNWLVPYSPNSEEIIGLGYNALLNEPMVDTVVQNANRQVKGIVFRDADGNVLRKALANKPYTITAYVEKGLTDVVEYQFRIKPSSSTSWATIASYNTNNSVVGITGESELFDIEVSAKYTNLSGQPVKTYTLYGFSVLQYDNGENNYKLSSTIGTCNRILLHWDRLILYGDVSKPTQFYVSALGQADYFPVTFSVRVDTGKQQPLVSFVRIQDYLVIFTKNTIHAFTGKDPSEYRLFMINETIGCVTPRSAILTGNVITFLSEEGVFILKPNNFKLDQLNVQRVDTKIKAQMLKDENACALNYDSQYWLAFPDKKVVYRYYYEQNVWVKDVSNELDIVQFIQKESEIYHINKSGLFYKHSKLSYKDGTSSYDMVVETKYFDLSKSFNFKKLKKLYVLGRNYNTYDAQFFIKVYADSAVVLNPESGQAIVDGHDTVVWQTTLTPNMEFNEGTVFGTWNFDASLGGQYLSVEKARIRGKCRRVKLVFTNNQDKEVELFGFGLEFKLKKP